MKVVFLEISDLPESIHPETTQKMSDLPGLWVKRWQAFWANIYHSNYMHTFRHDLIEWFRSENMILTGVWIWMWLTPTVSLALPHSSPSHSHTGKVSNGTNPGHGSADAAAVSPSLFFHEVFLSDRSEKSPIRERSKLSSLLIFWQIIRYNETLSENVDIIDL